MDKAEQWLEQLQGAAPDGVAAPQPAAPAQTPGMQATIGMMATAAKSAAAVEAAARSLLITDPTVAAAAVDNRKPHTPDGQLPEAEPPETEKLSEFEPSKGKCDMLKQWGCEDDAIKGAAGWVKSRDAS